MHFFPETHVKAVNTLPHRSHRGIIPVCACKTIHSFGVSALSNRREVYVQHSRSTLFLWSTLTGALLIWIYITRISKFRRQYVLIDSYIWGQQYTRPLQEWHAPSTRSGTDSGVFCQLCNWKWRFVFYASYYAVISSSSETNAQSSIPGIIVMHRFEGTVLN